MRLDVDLLFLTRFEEGQ